MPPATYLDPPTTLDVDSDPIGQVFVGKLVNQIIWENRKRIWWQQLQGPPEALLPGILPKCPKGPKTGRGTRSSSPGSAPLAQTQRPAPGRRLDLWICCWGMAKAKPWLGRGLHPLFSPSAVQPWPFLRANSIEQLLLQRASLVENLAAVGSQNQAVRVGYLM